MINRIVPKSHIVPATNTKKEYTPPPVFGSVSTQDIVSPTPHSSNNAFTAQDTVAFSKPSKLHFGAISADELQRAMNAARSGQLEPIKALDKLHGMAIFHTYDQALNTVLHYAAQYGHKNILEYACNKYPPTIGRKIAHWGSALGGWAVGMSMMPVNPPLGIATIVGGGATSQQFTYINLNMYNGDGYTPLHLAARNGKRKAVVFLVKNGAQTDINAYYSQTHPKRIVQPGTIHFTTGPAKDGKTPGQLATENGHHKIARIIKNGARALQGRNSGGSTPSNNTTTVPLSSNQAQSSSYSQERGIGEVRQNDITSSQVRRGGAFSPSRLLKDLSSDEKKDFAHRTMEVAGLSQELERGRTAVREDNAKGSSSTRKLSPVSEKIRQAVSPVRRALEAVQNELALLKKNNKQLDVDVLNANIANIKKWGNVPSFLPGGMTPKQINKLVTETEEKMGELLADLESIEQEKMEKLQEERGKNKRAYRFKLLMLPGNIIAAAISGSPKDLVTPLTEIATNPEAAFVQKAQAKQTGREWVEEIQSKRNKILGIKSNPFEKRDKLAKNLESIVRDFENRITYAQNLKECFAAVERFKSRIIKDELGFLRRHGTPEQKTELAAVEQMILECHTLLKPLRGKTITEEDLKRFEQGVRQMVDRVQGHPKLHKVAETFLKKNIGEMAPLVDDKGRKQVPIQEVFSSNPARTIFINQNSGHTCYMLSILDSILHSGRALDILKTIKIFSTNNGYIVIFPGMPKREIRVTTEDINHANVVDSGNWLGPKILEQAYLNLLGKLKPEERERFQDPSQALIHIFGNHSQIKIQSVNLIKVGDQLVVVPLEKEERHTPLTIRYNAHQDRFQLRNERGEFIRNLTPEDLIERDQPKMRRLFEEQKNQGKTDTFDIDGPLPGLYADKEKRKRLIRYKFAAPDHFIGENEFKDSDKQTKLRTHIQEIQNLKKEGKPLPLDIWTATKAGSEHYCSIRMDESTPNAICVFDPLEKTGLFKDDRIKKVNINDFFEKYKYNVVGMCLPGK